jgi:hypothetical protein
MERVALADERLDDLSRQMDAGLERVDRDIRDLRGEMNAGFTELRAEIAGLRTVVYRFGGTILAAVLASTLLHGI